MVTTVSEAALRVPGASDRKDLATFLTRVSRLDESAVVRLRVRDDGRVVVWTATQFDVLACRAVRGELRTPDISAAVDEVLRGLQTPDADGYVHTGFPMDSVWRGALPSDNGFEYLDDIPARTVLDLAQRGGELAREHGSAHGPPVSLLDQSVVTVDGADGQPVDVPMRCVFALTAMGFVPTSPTEDEPVRVRAVPAWLRLDARFGSVYRRRTDLTLRVR
ncbi:hypothetical protein DE4585_03158 [Mycobacteroides salmoniphilum]|uniref:Uncharacterized protein n=1 Tax=Mycobacteroides salmoniphilum TaxID=404941 RepID=A0A4R8S361_9MYCO|nr:hypothetical protein DE4585_03158 [Mycobacteroides salmoniphilum]TDZ81490.1 hypothetical protein DE4586_01445 [Mycobacteroides salmoniphilum]TDZ88990.1 hypothetical protein DE4587_01361 [Mycobacteroides salmoniphilum]